MILRNTAGQPILIGPLLTVADGTAQTTGAAIAVRKDGVDVGSPGGTLIHVDAGVWQYTATQGETDCGILGLVLTKADAIAVPLNVLTVAAGFHRATRGIPICTVDTGATTTSIPLKTSTPTPTTVDQWKGRIVVFSNTTATAALRGQASDITANTTTALTVTALTTAPAEDDEFSIQ
jgi:hypothetical protein